MKIRDALRALPIGSWLAIAGGLVALAVFLWLITEPGRQRQRALEATAAGTVSAAGDRASSAAGEAIAAAGERQADRTELGRKNREEILSAPGADAPVDPGVGDAGLRALCLREPARDPRCRGLLKPRPAPAA